MGTFCARISETSWCYMIHQKLPPQKLSYVYSALANPTCFRQANIHVVFV